MTPRPKRLPRLWCALQGLLPLESCLAAQRGELAWPATEPDTVAAEAWRQKTTIRVAARQESRNVRRRGPA